MGGLGVTMKKLLTASAAILAAMGSAALAADFPTPVAMPAPAPMAAAGPSWTGFYLGAGGGWQWGEFDLDHATFDAARR